MLKIILIAILAYFLIKYRHQIEDFLSKLFLNKDKEYTNFVLEHSLAIKELKSINEQFEFSHVVISKMSNSYDNENFYETISPEDYLTYQLVYKKKEVVSEINKAETNSKLFQAYKVKVQNCVLDRYDTEELPEDLERLKKIEDKNFRSLIKRPVIDFYIDVTLYQTLINGRRVDSKSERFEVEEILEIISRLSQKRGDFYLDEEIWQAICRVERGKVSNKMRFAIYERDGNRCKKCGSRYDLEIDHIFPVSKGGKSTYENLQTLCHDCNIKKSNTIERGAIDPRARHKYAEEICPNCEINLVLIKGKYGDFYGCPNYPKCKYTKQK